MTLPGLISAEPFVPHAPQHLIDAGVFPTPLPEKAYGKLVSDYNALDDIDVSRIVYESDGLKVNGLMALPKRLGDGAHPLLIYNRGGTREYGKLTVLSVMRSMVPYARQGYMVFASNYRGNEGGEGAEEFGGSDLNDVLNLMELAQRHPAFDGRNRFMIGHSRGSMMTLMAIRAGAKLNAAVGIAGISDLRQSGRERPSMEERVFRRFIPGIGAQREAEYDKRSPILWADELRVPLLLLHGDADEAVEADHSVRLDAKLTELGLPHELHIYPGGNHSLIRFWDDVTKRCSDWLARYRV